MRHATWGFIVMLFLPATVAIAQQSSAQDDALAAAARRVREEKKQQPKTSKVWNNDNIPKNSGSLSVIGQSANETPAATESAQNIGDKPAAAATATESKNGPTPAEQKSALESELAAAKEQLQTLQNDLDILQRKRTLDQQMYYGKPDFASDKAGAAALQDEQDQIDAKHQEMTAAQQKVADAQAKLNAGSTETKNNPQ